MNWNGVRLLADLQRRPPPAAPAARPAAGSCLRRRVGWTLVELGLRLAVPRRPAVRALPV